MSCFISHLGIIISQEQLMVKLVLYVINQLLLYLGEVSILLIEPMHIASGSNMRGFNYYYYYTYAWVQISNMRGFKLQRSYVYLVSLARI